MPAISRTCSRCGRCRDLILDDLFGEVPVGELAHEALAHRARGSVAARAVHDQVHADALVRVQVQGAVKVLRVAVVADDAAATVALLEESEQHAVERRQDRQAGGERPAGRVRREDALACELAVLQPRDHEFRHVGDRGRRAAGGRDAEQLEGIRGTGAQHVTPRHPCAEILRQHLAGRGRRHAERGEHVPVHVIVIGFSAHPLDEVAGERDSVVAVGRHFARRIDPPGNPGLEVFLRRREPLRPVGDKALDRLLEPRCVGHQVSQRDGLPVARRDPEVEVVVDVAIQFQAPGFHLLHHGGPGEELADRTGAKQRVGGIDADTGRAVCMAVTAGDEHFAALDDHDRRTRDVALRERVGKESLEPGLGVGPGQRPWRIRGARRLGDGEEKENEDCNRNAHDEFPLDLHCRFQ